MERHGQPAGRSICFILLPAHIRNVLEIAYQTLVSVA